VVAALHGAQQACALADHAPHGVDGFLTRYLTGRMSISMAVGTVLLLVYMAVVIRRDFPLSGLPIIGKYFKK
jgi:hypothetical protein